MYPFDLADLRGPFPSSDRNFEELCSMLVKAKNLRSRVVSLAPPDAGIDFLLQSNRKSVAYQCKYFVGPYGRAQEQQIRDSLARASENRRRIRWDQYVVCLPRNLTAIQLQRLFDLGTSTSSQIGLVDLSRILEWLAQYPHVKTFFFPMSTDVFANALSLLLARTERARHRRASIAATDPFQLLPPGIGLARLLQSAAELLAVEGEWADAVALLTDALRHCVLAGDRADIQRCLAVLYGQQGKEVLARRLFRQAASLAPNEMAPFVLVDEAEFLSDRGRYSEAAKLLTEALDRGADVFVEEQRARCIAGLGDIAFARGDYPSARAEYEDAIQLAGTSRWMTGALTARLADVYRRQGLLFQAEQSYLQAEELLEVDGDIRLLAEVLTGLGLLMFLRGQLSLAEHYHRRALLLEERLGHLRGKAVCWTNLAHVALARGDNNVAAQLAQRTLDVCRRGRNLHGESYAWAVLGRVALNSSDVKAARRAFHTAARIADKVKSVLGRALAEIWLAETDRIAGSGLALAALRCVRARRSTRRLKALPELALALRQSAAIELARGNVTGARRFVNEAAELYAMMGLEAEKARAISMLDAES